MILPVSLPITALRAFEASARHLNFTLAGEELGVGRSSVSYQVRRLEIRLGVSLFVRYPRWLVLTDHGAALLPGVSQSFARMAEALEQVERGVNRRAVIVGVDSAFAVGWLLTRLPDFQAEYPLIDLRVHTHNGRGDYLSEPWDCAIHLGAQPRPERVALQIAESRLAPLCSPETASLLHTPADLARQVLLKTEGSQDWALWAAAAKVDLPPPGGPTYDSDLAMIAGAVRSTGVALAHPVLFDYELSTRRLVQALALEVPGAGYFLSRPRQKRVGKPVKAFIAWCVAAAAETAL
jgi:LysR family transcriptional regulator of beta-lactamase